MKFDFEKHIPSPSEEVVPTPEQNQEQFEEEILREVERLGTNLERLKAEIDEFGGPEQFKEYFEKSTSGYMDAKGNLLQNKAGDTLRHISEEIRSNENDQKQNKKFRYLFTAISALSTAGFYFAPFDENNKALLVPAVLAAIPAIITKIFEFQSSIKNRKLENQKKREELKFKMTGTEIKGASY